MDANTKRTLAAAIRAAKSVNTASDKLVSTTAEFIAAAGGFDAAIKVLNDKRGKDSTWKAEREASSPIYRVYNCVSVAKSRAKGPGKRGARQTTGKAGEQAGKAGEQAGKAGEQAGKTGEQAATRPATPSDLAAALLLLDLPSLIAAFEGQTAVTTAIAVDRLKAVIAALDPTPAPRKRAPRRTK